MEPLPSTKAKISWISRRWVALGAAMGLFWLFQPCLALAHPLGNFSISHYSAIRVESERIELLYLIDMAEIPAFQELQEQQIVPAANHPSLRPYLAKKAEALKRDLHLEINGRRVALEAHPQEIIFPAGAGGLPTLKLAILYRAPLARGESNNVRLRYADGNYPERAGWKEIVASPTPGVSLIQSSVPERDRSAQLSDYPADLLNSPPQDLEASIIFSIAAPARNRAGEHSADREIAQGRSEKARATPLSSGAVTARAKALAQMTQPESASGHAAVENDQVPAELAQLKSLVPNRQARPRDAFTELMASRQWSLAMILFALAVAAGLGGLHALEPGHGKTLVAAYLVGSRGTMKHAFLLGLIVTAAHTAGVYFLGAITLYASKYIVPEQLYPWLALASGLMILGLGCVLFLRRYRAGDLNLHRRDSAHYDPRHDHHEHSHRHGHAHHHHELTKQVSMKQLLALGISGGIVPCPAALVVLLSAVSLQRIGFGLLLIAAFSMGLAAVLVAIGMMMVYAQTFAARFKGTGPLTTRWLPLTSSAFIVLFGMALTWQALQSAGFRIFSSL